MNLEIRWMWSFSTLKVFFWIRITSCRCGICATSNFKTHCLGPQEGVAWWTTPDVSPEVRERSVGHGIGTALLRPIIAGEEQRRQQTHYGPIVAQLSTGITRRPTRKLTLPTESELETEEATLPGPCGRRGKPESTISRRLSQGYTKIYFPRDFQLGRSSKPPILWPTEGTTGSECFLGRSCVRIRRSFLRETKTRTSEYSMELWGRPSRANIQEVHQYHASLFLSAVPKRKQMVCKFRTTHLLLPGVFIQENLSSNRDTISIRFTLLIKLKKFCSTFVKSITTEFAYQEKSLSGSPFRKNWYTKS